MLPCFFLLFYLFIIVFIIDWPIIGLTCQTVFIRDYTSQPDIPYLDYYYIIGGGTGPPVGGIGGISGVAGGANSGCNAGT